MAEIAAVIPVKQLAMTKQRLAESMDSRRRRDLIEASLTDALESLGNSRRLQRTVIVTNDRAVQRIAEKFDAEIVPEGDDPGHSAAAVRGIEHLMRGERPPESVILLPADCPLLDSREVDRLLTGHPSPFVTIVPDRHGTGTNALVLSPPDVLAPAFGEGSRRRHESLARGGGTPYTTDAASGLGLDLDTPADLIAFATAFEKSRHVHGRRTAKVLGV